MEQKTVISDKRNYYCGLISQLETANISKSKYPRPELSSIYASPRNEIEQKLADIWQQLLGIEKVGIYDNFFELGGDSLLSTQVVLKAKQTGLQLTPDQPFEHPTIADLAVVAQKFEMIEVNMAAENINYSQSDETEDFKPSEFPQANLTETELEKFLTKISGKD